MRLHFLLMWQSYVKFLKKIAHGGHFVKMTTYGKRTPVGVEHSAINKKIFLEGCYNLKGFSAIELIIVMAISAMLMTNLFKIYNQITKNMVRVDQFVFQDTQMITLQNRLSRDFAGFSGIWFTQAELQNRVQAKEKQAGKEEEKSIEKKDEDKKSCKFLYSVNNGENLDTLMFITTSSLQSYGAAVSRFVKVVYKLEPDPAHKDLYILMRKEIGAPTEDIESQALQQAKFYELVHGIKSMKVEYVLVDKIELQKQTAQKNKEKSQDGKDAGAGKEKKDSAEQPKAIIRKVKEWVAVEKSKQEKKPEKSDADNEKQDENDLGGAAVPKFITIEVALGQTDQQQERVYTLEFSIQATVDAAPANVSAMKRSKNPEPVEKAEKAEKDGQKLGQSPAGLKGGAQNVGPTVQSGKGGQS